MERLQRENERMANERRMDNNRVEDSPAVVNGLVRRLENLNNEVTLPKFKDDSHMHPNKYLEKIEKYFNIKNTSQANKLDVVERSLEGRAQIWYEANNFENYLVFKTAFLNEFHSIPNQVKIKSKWLTRRYESQNGSLQTYFYDQISEAQYFQPKYTDYELHYHIIQQLPIKYRQNLVSIDYSNAKNVAQVLAHMDLNNEARENEKKRCPEVDKHSTGNKYYNNRSISLENRQRNESRNWRSNSNVASYNHHSYRRYPQQSYDHVGNNSNRQISGMHGMIVANNQYQHRNTNQSLNGGWQLPNFNIPPPTQVSANQPLNDNAAQ
ncbi:uncharacterized protein LOC125501641 [Athalia rosae]|uniref:uncharacterized protein LOC125501641 n=1 Tax=Athalia rosae TaxID=37344 RepID=UPI0020341186|nr:uncharacterized protein LOC125501641 [Athalia rosae]XP_048513869.1 uncharacterized protein LOC125501641 [Athalia rosae]